MNGKIEQLKENSRANNIPIMLDDGMKFLLKTIEKYDANDILEIGTAVGYSSIMMATTFPKPNIISIEKDEKRYKEAAYNISSFNLKKRITLINDDALNVELEKKFDLIFIDAAKSKNESLFLHYKDNLKENGIIVTDNLKFHGFVAMNPKEIKNRNTRQLVGKIKKYIEFLKTNNEFYTTFYNDGDGVSISKRKEKKENENINKTKQL